MHQGAGGRRRRRWGRWWRRWWGGWWWWWWGRCGGRRRRCRGWGGGRGRRAAGRGGGGGGDPANGRGGGGRCVGGVGRVATTGHQRAGQRHGGHSLEYPAPGREIRAVVQFLVHCFGGLGWAEFRAFWSVHRQFKANVVPGR